MGVESAAISKRARGRVWELHKQGLNNRQIADRIGVSDRTVARIIAKMRDAQKCEEKHHDSNDDQGRKAEG